MQSRSTTSRTRRCTPLPGLRSPDLHEASTRRSSVVVANNNVYTSIWAPGDGRSGQRRPDARPRHERVRARRGHAVGHRLGRDDADEALLRVISTDFAGQAVPAQLRRDQRRVRRRLAEHLRPRRATRRRRRSTSRRRRRSQTNALCWEANVITFNNSNVLGSANLANIPTTFENGWLDLGFHPDTVSGGEHVLREPLRRRLPRWVAHLYRVRRHTSACRWLALRFSRSPTARSPSMA